MAEPEAEQLDSCRIDFASLRSEVEAATILPTFGDVARRARWRRNRSRITTIASVLAVVAVLGPAGVVADLREPRNGIVAGPDRPIVDLPVTPSASASVEVTMEAVAGTDLNHTYTLIDVCQGDSCNLQLARLSGPSSTLGKPLRENLLRSTPTAWLDSISLTALSNTSLLVGAVTDDEQWQSQEVDLNSSDGPPVTNTPAVTTADRPVQLTRYGAVQAIQAHTGRQLPLPTQPPLRQPNVVESVAPAKGIWVIGADKVTGQLSVAVSRDAGHTWAAPSLGIAASEVSAFDQPVFATYTGMQAYLMVRLSTGEFALFWTEDGGITWQRRSGQPPWPQPVPTGAPYGLVVRPDGSLLAWLSVSPTITYLESNNAGAQFRVMPNGPGGPVYAVSDGYVELGSTPAVSRDGATWAPAPVTYAVPGG